MPCRALSDGSRQVDEDQAEQQDAQDDRQRGAVTEVEEAEDLRVGVPPDDGGGIGRAPARHDVDEVEGRDRDDRLVDQHQRQRRLEVRQGHEAEAVPAAGPVDANGVVKLGRNDLQSRQQEHGRQRALLPHVRHHHAQARAERLAHPGHVAVDGAGGEEQAVQDAVVAVENPAPDDAADDGGNRPRQQDDELEHGAAEHALVEEQGDAEPVQGDGGHRQRREHGGGPERAPEVVTGNDFPEVLQPDEVMVEGTGEDVLVQAQVHAVEQRVDGERRDRQDDRQDGRVGIRRRPRHLALALSSSHFFAMFSSVSAALCWPRYAL